MCATYCVFCHLCNETKRLISETGRNTHVCHQVSNSSPILCAPLSRCLRMTTIQLLDCVTLHRCPKNYRVSFISLSLKPTTTATTKTTHYTHMHSERGRNSCTLMNALHSFHRKPVHMSPLMQPFHSPHSKTHTGAHTHTY